SRQPADHGPPLALEEASMLYLLMAVCWFILGGILLLWHGSDPRAFATDIGGVRISFGWFASTLWLYDRLRWWLPRASRKRARRPRDESSRQRAATADSSKPGPPPNANFDFTSPPPRSL